MDFELESQFIEDLSLYKNTQNLDANSCFGLNRIDTELFDTGKANFGLENLFNMKDAKFLHIELAKLQTNFQTNYQNFQERFHPLSGAQLQIAINSPAFRKTALTQLVKNFEKGVTAIFSPKALEAETLPSTFVDNCFHRFFELSFNNLQSILTSIIECSNASRISELVDKSVSNGSFKRIPWNISEEDALAQLMHREHPLNIPSEQLASFCETYKRTRSAVINKMQKIKKKFGENFQRQSAEIIGECLEKRDIALEQKVLRLLNSGKQFTYDALLHEMGIRDDQLDEKNELNQLLYNLLNANRIRCDEKDFVDLAPGARKQLSNCNSLIIKRIMEIMIARKLTSIQLDDLREILISEFRIVDRKAKDLDAQLAIFLKDSVLVSVKKKRIFY